MATVTPVVLKSAYAEWKQDQQQHSVSTVKAWMKLKRNRLAENDIRNKKFTDILILKKPIFIIGFFYDFPLINANKSERGENDYKVKTRLFHLRLFALISGYKNLLNAQR